MPASVPVADVDTSCIHTHNVLIDDDDVLRNDVENVHQKADYCADKCSDRSKVHPPVTIVP